MNRICYHPQMVSTDIPLALWAAGLWVDGRFESPMWGRIH